MGSMRRTAVAVAGALLIGGTEAASQPDGVLSWGIQRHDKVRRVGRRDANVAGTVEEVVQNQEARGGYFAKAQIGNPGQAVTLQLDTGSSDVWVPSSTSQVCKQASSRSASGCSLGSYTSAKSSSFADLGSGTFNIAYVDGSHASGNYFTDHFSIGGITLTNMTMGLGVSTDIPYGLAGVGYALNEASVSGQLSAAATGQVQPYPNLPVALMNEGLTKTVAYSLWLNDLDASAGNILFGGIDTAKYKGDLSRINILPTSGSTSVFTSFNVDLTSIQACSSTGADNLQSTEFPVTVVLDSGTTLSYVPTDLAEEIWKEAGAVYEPSIEMAIIPCSQASSKGVFSFGFAGTGGPTINVTMDELVLDMGTGSRAPSFTSGPYAGMTACEFGIQNFSSSPYLLGDTFLRSAYVVYDLMNNQIALAPTDFNATSSNIVAFASMGAQIPSATPVANQAEVTSPAGSTNGGLNASAGFSDGTNSAEGAKNAGIAGPQPFVGAQLAVMGVALAFALAGSGIFFAL